MANAMNPDEVLRRARDMQESRLAMIDDLVRTNVELADARERVSTAERDYSRSYAAAVSAGWTTGELSKIGFAEAGKTPRPRRQPRRQNTASEESATE
ncbi:hypothetical protein ACO03V_15450 [Microbacterium sp. HMH0099]|uniref:hypothetical protein n=1 Tax=Microbacterium sp. HMH0099 TaxID=3414026 RepID=UPI003BF6A0DF